MIRTFKPTEEQRTIIELGTGAHLVIAPPGAGKTQILTERIITLLEGDPNGSFLILALTFTTKAAENLRERVERALGAESRRVTARTYHSFCLDLLQHYGDSVGFVADTLIYESEDDRLDVVRRALEGEHLPIPDDKNMRPILARIGEFKRALTEPDSVKDKDFAAVYSAYNRILAQYHACDFDDLLWLTWKLLSENPRVAKHCRRRYRHIMVDEAQDTSRAQYFILKALCGEEHRNIMLVADDDQSINQFAGASVRWLKAFEIDFHAKTHKLSENFRCASAIIEVANSLIKQNSGRPPSRPPMSSGVAAAGFVKAISFPDEEREASFVTSWIRALIGGGIDAQWCHPGEDTTVMPEELCVLGRNRYCLDTICSEFGRTGLQYLFNAGPRGLVETKPARLVIQCLRILQNPADRVTRENLLADWPEVAFDESAADLPPDAFFRRLASEPGLAAFATIMLAHLPHSDPSTLVVKLLEALESCPSDDEDFGVLKAADHANLLGRWYKYRDQYQHDSRSIGSFLGELSLAGRSVVEGPGVRVLTVHSAKGLGFRVVVVVGMNNGTFPDYRSLQEPDLSEERRTAYVAITRASRALLLTRPRSKQTRSGNRDQQESRFIGEAGLTMLRY